MRCKQSTFQTVPMNFLSFWKPVFSFVSFVRSVSFVSAVFVQISVKSGTFSKATHCIRVERNFFFFFFQTRFSFKSIEIILRIGRNKFFFSLKNHSDILFPDLANWIHFGGDWYWITPKLIVHKALNKKYELLAHLVTPILNILLFIYDFDAQSASGNIFKWQLRYL